MKDEGNAFHDDINVVFKSAGVSAQQNSQFESSKNRKGGNSTMVELVKGTTFGRYVLLLITNLFSYINKIVIKDENRVLFYDSAHDFLDDNTEAMYSWLKEHDTDNRYKMVVCEIRRKKSPFADYKSVGAIGGVHAFLRSKYVFFSYGDFRIQPARGQIVTNQWHGTPIKRIGKLTNDVNHKKEKLNNFNYLLATSKIFVPIMAEAFGCSKSCVKVVGNARNDYLLSSKNVLSLININRSDYKKILLWMPTFRVSKDGRFHDGASTDDETSLPILYSYDDIENFNQSLKEMNILVVIKFHPYAKFRKKEYSNIKVMTNNNIASKGVRLYEFVKEFDALITDYSSIYCDYLMLNRPIGFTLDDYEAYKATRGFVFDNVLEYMPGQYIYSLDDMIQFVSDVVEGHDEYRMARKRLIPILCGDTDGRNCERLAEIVGIKTDI